MGTGTRRLLQNDVVEAISCSIIDGTLQPGAAFSVRAVSQKLLVAPATVRAALPVLASLGFLELRAGRSPRVCSFEESAAQAAVSLGVLMRGVVAVSVADLSRAAATSALQTVHRTINAIARPADYDLQEVAIDGYQRWAALCVNRPLGAILATRSGALALASTGPERGVPHPVTAVALHALATAIDRSDPAAARDAVARMHGLQ